ncbi:Abi-alpha family protein [Aquimarina hainanensis]|uniref:Abi-alpha family protein n=1 Tax=Aquimarina hainanensis TaxID=1578017 RepID=A0ABW5ND11_9FLAO
MEEQENNQTSKSLDLVGLGETAKAIPKEVYVETTKALIDSFNKIVAPITETTSGFGRYIRQKFDNMVDAEKAVGAYTIQKAVEKAQLKGQLNSPKHLKSFVKSFEEASKEVDPTLHEMWENILANQLIDSEFHPRYVNILSNFSASEAELLLRLNTFEEIGKDHSGYFGSPRNFNHYVLKNHDKELNTWTYSCNVLLEFELAEVQAPNREIYEESDRVTILYITNSGKRFLNAVTLK